MNQKSAHQLRIEIRPIRTLDELRQCIDVQISAWGMNPEDVTPLHVLKALIDNGGIVLGAFDENGRVVGFCWGFFAVSENGTIEYFYSHETGVREEFKNRGVGYLLKLAQRAYVLRRGVKLIKWTFDPAQSLNAYFNFAKLGVIAREFYENYYGELRDRINRAMPTDRFRVEWWLQSKRVIDRIERGVPPPSLSRVSSKLGEDLDVVLDVRITEKGFVAPSEPVLSSTKPYLLVAIPRSISELRDRDPDLALCWRLAIRKVMKHYVVAKKYTVCEYLYDKGSEYGYYLLTSIPVDKILEGEVPWS